MIHRFITPHGKLLRLMCISTHNHRNMMLGNLAEQVVGGIVVGATALVNATGIDFDDEMFLSDEFHAMVGQLPIPLLIFREEAVLVVHLNFVEMSDNVKLLGFNHFKTLFPESGDGLADVIAEKVMKSLVVDFTLGTIDEPDMVTVVGAHQMHAPDDVIEVKSVAIEGKRLGHAGDKVAFQSFEQLQIRVLLLQRIDNGGIFGDGGFADTELILERNRGMGGKAELPVVQFGSPLHETLERILSVAVGGVGVVIVLHPLESIAGGDVEEVVVEQHNGVVVTVGEEEEAGACIHLQGKRDVGELVFRTAKHIDSEDEVAVVVPADTMMRKGGAQVQSAADEPVEAVAASLLIHKIGIEGEHNGHGVVLVVHDEAVAEVELDAEVVGGESFERDTVHEADGAADSVVVGGHITANLCKRDRAGKQR